MNNRGSVMIGIMIMVMAVVIFIATLPAIKSVMDDARGCSYLNCAGYVDKDASAAACGGNNQSYVSTYEEDDLSCTILGLGIPYLILGVLVALISKLLHGKLTERVEPEPYYGGGY